MLKRLLKEKFFKDSLIYIIGTLIIGVLGYVFQFVISRKLSVSEYGELQSLISILSILGVFTSAVTYFSLKYSSVFAKEDDREGIRSFIKWMTKKISKPNFALFFLFLAATPFIYNYLRLSDFYGLIIIGMAILFIILSSVYSGVLSGWEYFVIVNSIAAAGAILKLASGYFIVSFYPSASFVAAAFLAGSIGSFMLARFFIKKKFSSSGKDSLPKDSEWQEKYFSDTNIKKSVMPIIAFSLMVVLINNIDVILIKNLTTAEITGHYGALKILGSIIIAINSAIIAAVLPRACADGHAGQRINKKIVFGAYGTMLAISAVSTLIYFLFPKIITNMLFGPKYALFTGDLWLFGIIAAAISFLTLESNFAYARHDFKISYILGGVAVLMVSGIYLFHDSIKEVAWVIIISFSIGYFAAMALNLIHRKKFFIEKEAINLSV